MIVDSFGNEIDLPGEVEICLNVTTKDDIEVGCLSLFCLFVLLILKIQKTCLSYFDESTQEWKCEDSCLEKNDQGQYCGSTAHFTSFAILLQGKKNDCNKDEDELDQVVGYLSIAGVSMAIIFIIGSIVIYEIYFQHKKAVKLGEIDRILQKVKQHRSEEFEQQNL